MFKKISKVLVLTLILSLVTSQTAYAKLTYSNKMFDGKTYYHDYYLYVNSKEIKSPSMINKDYTNYIPLKAVVEAMGDKCTISGKTATVTQKNKNKLIFTANNSKYKINGKTAQFANQSADLVNYTNYYPIIKNNVFYIPYGNLTKLFGYDIHESYTQGKPTSKSLTDTTKYYIGKAPSYYYKKSEFPYIYQYEIDAKPNNPGDKLKILPKENFTAFNKTSTTKDPVKDLLHFSDTMPDFVVDVPSKFPGYNTDTSDAVKKKYIDALRNGTYQPDHTDFGYDAIGFYSIDSTNIRMAQTKKNVEIYLTTFDYDEWYVSDKDLKPVDVLNFNSAVAIHSVLEYYLPSGGDKLFNNLYNGTFDWHKPAKYSRDNCTVTIESVVGATIVNIDWN